MDTNKDKENSIIKLLKKITQKGEVKPEQPKSVPEKKAEEMCKDIKEALVSNHPTTLLFLEEDGEDNIKKAICCCKGRSIEILVAIGFLVTKVAKETNIPTEAVIDAIKYMRGKNPVN